MRWTVGHIVLAGVLVTCPLGILYLLRYLMPKWAKENEEEGEGK